MLKHLTLYKREREREKERVRDEYEEGRGRVGIYIEKTNVDEKETGGHENL